MDFKSAWHRLKNNHNVHNTCMTIFVIFIPLVVVTSYLYVKWDSLNTNQMPVVVGLLSAVYAISVAFFTIKTQRRISREKNSIEFEASYRTKKIDKAWRNLRTPIRELALPEFLNLIKKDEKIRKSLIRILNEWERAASGIYNELYDEDFLYKAYGSNVLEIFRVSSDFILEKQNQNPRVLIHFTKLAVRWQIRRTREEVSGTPLKLTLRLRELHTASTNLDVVYQSAANLQNESFVNLSSTLSSKLSLLRCRENELGKAFKPFL